MVEKYYKIEDIQKNGTIHIVLSKAEISILKKLLKKEPYNFRIVGDAFACKCYFIFCIKEEIQSKISKKWETLEHWLYLPIDYSGYNFKIQGTHDHFMSNFLLWLHVTSGDFYIDFYFNNASDLVKEKEILVQTITLNDHKNKHELHLHSYPFGLNNPFLESMTFLFIYPPGDSNNYLPQESMTLIEVPQDKPKITNENNESEESIA
jgi:hypothetical protein